MSNKKIKKNKIQLSDTEKVALKFAKKYNCAKEYLDMLNCSNVNCKELRDEMIKINKNCVNKTGFKGKNKNTNLGNYLKCLDENNDEEVNRKYLECENKHCSKQVNKYQKKLSKKRNSNSFSKIIKKRNTKKRN
jgi:hypothetical protein